ncbi:hypothetical protein [Halostagnicola sp. A-GB9-2]|uniref:hypothetical protein n=1 Tax=Halostagnicola sp. A-GB9-2 TaxID=3048066 RepID=UPI0024BF56B1|nr:hypothetical protein [Halostagnicola sp. A-GB9-2]MDJ1433564.1 hypothetical protein [Halostagnicola sp. A-GB9-2]
MLVANQFGVAIVTDRLKYVNVRTGRRFPVTRPEALVGNRIVVAILKESGDEFNPARIYKHDGVSKGAWYRYRDDLESAGLFEDAGTIENSPLYRVLDGPIANNLRAAFEAASN